MMTHAAALNTIDAIDALLGVHAQDRLLAYRRSISTCRCTTCSAKPAGAELVLPTGRRARCRALDRADRAASRDAVEFGARAAGDGAGGAGRGRRVPQRARARCCPATGSHSICRRACANGARRVRSMRSAARPRPASGRTCRRCATCRHWRSIPYGRPLPGQAYRVVDADGRDVPDYVPGELLIGGDSLARGYRNDPELTAQRLCSKRRAAGIARATGAATGPTARSNSWGARSPGEGARAPIELGEIEPLWRASADRRCVCERGRRRGRAHRRGTCRPIAHRMQRRHRPYSRKRTWPIRCTRKRPSRARSPLGCSTAMPACRRRCARIGMQRMTYRCRSTARSIGSTGLPPISTT